MNITATFFSPTGTTKKIVLRIARRFGDYRVHDFTLPQARGEALRFCETDLVILGLPVYAGRVPNVLLPFLTERIYGNGALAVPVIVYGNRDYDDALVELCDIMEKTGFHTLAAAAFIGEHAFSRKLAAGRPDDADLRLAENFADAVFEKLHSDRPLKPVLARGCIPFRPYYVPLDRLQNPVSILKVKPVTRPSCVNCGRCALVCPMGSIDAGDCSVVSGVCIKCGACVKSCPIGAKVFDDENFLYHQRELEERYARRAEPEWFI